MPKTGGHASSSSTPSTPSAPSTNVAKASMDPSGPSTKPEGPPTTPEAQSRRQQLRENANKTWQANKGKMAALAAIGVVAGAVLISGAVNQVACEHSTVNISSIEPAPGGVFPSWLNFLNGPPTQVKITHGEISWESPATKAWEPAVNGRDQLEISGTGTILDGKQITIDKYEDSAFYVKCGLTDCSNVSSSTGKAVPKCDYEDQVNQAIVDGATDIATTLGKGASSFMEIFFKSLPIVLFVAGLLIFYNMFTK